MTNGRPDQDRPAPAGAREAVRRAGSRAAAVLGMLPLLVLPGAAASGAPAACESTPVAARALPVYRPPLVSGDGDFAGHGPAVTVYAKRELWSTGAGDSLVVRVRIRAEETSTNWSRAEGATGYTLFTGAPGCRIDASLLPGGFDANGYLARPLHPNPYSLPPGNTGVNASFVAGYTVWDDRPGSDIGAYTGVRVTTRAFTVHYQR